MSNDNQTKDKLLAAAKQEFLEKGYSKTSIRNICKNSGVTTGALYFFFQDKNDLFRQLVEKPLQELTFAMKKHYEEERSEISEKKFTAGDYTEDLNQAMKAIDVIYSNYDAFCLLIMKAEGSSFEKCIDNFIDITEKHYRILADIMSEASCVERVDDYLIHLISYMQISSFARLVENNVSKEMALVQLRQIMKFMTDGWLGMFQKM